MWNFVDQIGFLRGFQKNLPKFVIGQGYGALIATRLLQQRSDHFEGAILINPLYDFGCKKFGSFQQTLMKAKQYINPHEHIDMGNDKETKELLNTAAKKDDLFYFDWQ